MAENIVLKTMICPTCGASLKAENNTDVITCVYCGNSVVPVVEPAQTAQNGMGGTIRVEGIKNASSALAYMEIFFEEYDWDAFAYAQTLSVAEINKIASSLKSTSADEKKTWLACFKAVYVPYCQKIVGCKRILDSVIEEYKQDNLDAYSKFDAYKRIVTMILNSQSAIVAELEKFLANAVKYGASPEEASVLQAEIDRIKHAPALTVYNSIESIPAISSFIRQKDAQIAEKLRACGIQAESEYARAKKLMEEKNYVQALNVLLSLNGYSDTAQLIEKLDKYYLISDVLEIEGKLYFFKKTEENLYDLYPAVNGVIESKAIVKGIKKIITNYADMLYYIDAANKLKKCNLATNHSEKIYDKSLESDCIYVYDRRVFMLASKGMMENDDRILIEVNLRTGTVNPIREDVQKLLSLTDNKLVYTVSKKDEDGYLKTWTNIINVDTHAITGLGTKQVTIEGFVDDYVVFTIEAPNAFNQNLYIKSLSQDGKEKLIEQNIFDFCNIIGGKLFYYIGNSGKRTLININCDGTERKEWPQYISDVLLEQGGWLYFVRRAGYNSVLCKSRLDGTKASIIAADIDRFIDIKNGYLYYINSASSLVKVRMDGSNLQELCDHVETVLSVKEDKIIFVSVDDRIKTGAFESTSMKIVKSVYAVDFTGSGKIKLAYDIKNAKAYDENTVYYIAAKQKAESAEGVSNHIDSLYKLDTQTNQTEKLLDLQVEAESEKMSAFMIALGIAAIAFFFALIALVAQIPALLLVSAVVCILALFVAVGLKLCPGLFS